MANARILIVEDESIVAKDIQNSLTGMGYTVAGIVAFGEEAVERVGALKPDLILMDVMLKGAIDGIEAAERIRREHSVPVIYLTAYTDDDTLRRAKVTEAFGYLLKPFEDRELRTTIEMALYKHTMERKLRESREWMETTLRCISDAVIATDASGCIQFMNTIAETLTGWKSADAIGRKLTDVFCLMKANEMALVENNLTAILKKGVVVHPDTDAVLISKDGRQVPIAHSAAPIRDDHGTILGVVASFRDITEQKDAQARERQLQDRLLRSQRMESLGSLAGGVAHNLNNILGPMVNYPDLIVKNLPPDSALRQDLQIIKNSACKAVDIIRDLLTLGRIGHFPMEPLVLNRILDRVVHSNVYIELQHGAPLVVVDLKWGADQPAIQGSEGLLQEMVENLLIHAFDAMPQGGRLTLTTSVEQVHDPVAGYELISPDTYVVLHVMNTGPSIDEQELNRMFEPFYANDKARSQKRSGLELAIVYAVLKEHKGFIDVRALPDKGSDFIVYFPVSLAGQAGALPEIREQLAPLDFRGNETVLVVDDEEDQRRIVARWLRTDGYKVLTAHNGQTAIELLDSAARAQGPAIDLVLLDMIMADDFDGLDTYKKMLELNPRQKVIMVSGFAVTDRIKEALTLGVGQYIQKPYDFDNLGRAVRRELDKP
ncbi:MAG: response regulator [Kiritimatiellaeota bacterium]|nr:response regulator [Kiritimatiellota bacterium]